MNRTNESSSLEFRSGSAFNGNGLCCNGAEASNCVAVPGHEALATTAPPFANDVQDTPTDFAEVGCSTNCTNDVERLATLPPIEYERVRIAEAGTLGIRVTLLDKAVSKARAAIVSNGSGQELRFPTSDPWPEPVDGAALLEEISALCLRYLQLPPNGDTAVALWVAMTYVTAAFDCLPLLFVTAPEKGCGKSTVLALVQKLCSRALSASNISTAALFRTIDQAAPTLLLDEVDSYMRDNNEMRGVLDSGHTRDSAHVIRLVGEGYEPRKFSTWCPKALAGIGRLAPTIEDRAIILTMQRLAPGEYVEKLRSAVQLPDLKRKLARWADDNLSCLKAKNPTVPVFLRNRAADNWEPLYAIAEAVGGEWPRRVLEASRSISVDRNSTEGEGTELLRDMRQAFSTTPSGRLATSKLIPMLVQNDAGRWADYRGGRPVTPRRLAEILGGFGISCGTVREGELTFKGYKVEDFEELFARYLPHELQPGGEIESQRHKPTDNAIFYAGETSHS